MLMLPIKKFVLRFVVALFHSRRWQSPTPAPRDSTGAESTSAPTTPSQQRFVTLEVSDWTQGGRIKAAKGVGQHESMLAALKNDPCAHCGGKFPAGSQNNGKRTYASVDHISPLNRHHTNKAKQGRDHWTNMTGCCSKCNNKKQNIKLIYFLWWKRDGFRKPLAHVLRQRKE